MRPVVVGLALVVFGAAAGPSPAQPTGPYAPPEGKFSVRFPGRPKVTTKTTEPDAGELTVTIATYASADNNIYMVTYTDFPAAPKPQNLAMLFTGVRDGIKGTGKQVGTDKEFEFGADKLPAREFVVDKGPQRLRFQVILRGSRLYQIAVIGTPDFAGGKDANLFFKSFELTN